MSKRMQKTFSWLKAHRPRLLLEQTLSIRELDCYKSGLEEGIALRGRTDRACALCVIADLERLRRDTWNQDAITRMQTWLKHSIVEDRHYDK